MVRDNVNVRKSFHEGDLNETEHFMSVILVFTFWENVAVKFHSGYKSISMVHIFPPLNLKMF